MDDDGSNVEQDRPSEPRHGAAPGGPQGWPGHVQLAGIAGAARRPSSGACGASIPTAPTGARSSAPSTGEAPNAFHFQTQLSDGDIVDRGVLQPEQQRLRHAISSCPPSRPEGYPAFGPAFTERSAQSAVALGRPTTAGSLRSLPSAVQPVRHRVADAVLPWHGRRAGRLSRCAARKTRPAVGKVTHPSAAPDNHLLTVWSPGPVNRQYTFRPASTAASTSSRTASRSTSRARCCSSRTIPSTTSSGRGPSCPTSASTASTSRSDCRRCANDGKLSPHLPEGTPFGLVGTSSLYKRESYPNGEVPRRQSDRGVSRAAPIALATGPRSVQHVGERRVAQLGQPGRRRRPCTPTTTSTPSASW